MLFDLGFLLAYQAYQNESQDVVSEGDEVSLFDYCTEHGNHHELLDYSEVNESKTF